MLEQFIGTSSRVLVVANDSYRSTPSSLAFSALNRYLEDIPELKVIIATGLHPRPTRDEMTIILGNDFRWASGSNLCHSDAYDRSQFDSIGAWSHGREILIHKLVGWAERIIVIGSVEPHYFAGFTGGPKSFVPGLSYHTTIEANHILAIDPSCQPAKIEGNPVAESIREAVCMLDCSKIYSIQFVTDPQRNVAGVFAGDLWESYHDAVRCATEVYVRPVQYKCHVVIAISGPPLDRNLYQLQKSFENSRSVVADGGSVIVVSPCKGGIGNDEFFALADEYPDPERILTISPQGYNLGFHKLYRTALHRQTINILVKSELDDAAVRKVYLEPEGDLQRRIDQEIAKFGDDARVIIVKDAGHVVPYVERAA
jgi:nickel-dependent lactate racemase